MKNKTINIYKDPITKTNLEGKARLIREYRPDHGDGLTMWIVAFLDEPGEEYLRTIHDLEEEIKNDKH